MVLATVFCPGVLVVLSAMYLVKINCSYFQWCNYLPTLKLISVVGDNQIIFPSFWESHLAYTTWLLMLLCRHLSHQFLWGLGENVHVCLFEHLYPLREDALVKISIFRYFNYIIRLKSNTFCYWTMVMSALVIDSVELWHDLPCHSPATFPCHLQYWVRCLIILPFLAI